MHSSQLIVDTEGSRLDRFLSEKLKETRAFIQKQIDAGRVRVQTKVVTKCSLKLRAGDSVDYEFEENTPSELEPVEGPLSILFEDEHFLAVNKPSGLVVHPAAGASGPTLVHYLLHYLRSSDFRELSAMRPGIVHRLDRGTSGVIVIAKNRMAQEGLAIQFRDRTLTKSYETIVWGNPSPTGTIESLIGRHIADRKRMSSHTNQGRESKTRYHALKQYPHFSLLDVMPHTGRTHQIRVHLFELGYPIVGDNLYGVRAAQGKKHQLKAPALRDFVEHLSHPLLHSRRLLLRHPIHGDSMEIVAPRPESFDHFLKLIETLDS